MREAVTNDFAKYTGSIKQIYQQRFTKKLFIETGFLGLLLVAFSLVPGNFKWLLIGLVLAVWVAEIYRTWRAVTGYEVFLKTVEDGWKEAIETIDWEQPEWLVYEDDDHYYLNKESDLKRIAKKGSRTIPSEIRGISLIVGENAQLFAQESAPIFIVYCDTTNIKQFDLAKKNADIIRKMQITKFKNKILRPFVSILIILAILWYLIGVF